MKKTFFFLLQIIFLYPATVYIDPGSISSSQDGSLNNPYKTFTGALASISTASVFLIKSSSILTDINGTLTISYPLNIT